MDLDSLRNTICWPNQTSVIIEAVVTNNLGYLSDAAGYRVIEDTNYRRDLRWHLYDLEDMQVFPDWEGQKRFLLYSKMPVYILSLGNKPSQSSTIVFS